MKKSIQDMKLSTAMILGAVLGGVVGVVLLYLAYTFG